MRHDNAIEFTRVIPRHGKLIGAAGNAVHTNHNQRQCCAGGDCSRDEAIILID